MTEKRKLHEELQRHLHGDLMKSVNEAMIGIKIHHISTPGQSEEQRIKISNARKRINEPTWPEIVALLQQVHSEISECTEPHRKR